MNLVPDNIKAIYPEQIKPEDIRKKLLEILGVKEIPEEFEYTIESTQEIEEILIYHITYYNLLGETVLAILCIPKHAEKVNLAGIICLPGTGGSAELISHTRFYRDNPYAGPLIGWARELTRRGFATLSISVWGCKDRQAKSGFDPQLQTRFLAPYGLTGIGIGVEETLMGARILTRFLSVDLCNIGVTGFSLGGSMSWYSMACCPLLGTAVTLCGGLGSMNEIIRKAVSCDGDPERHGPYFYIPHLLRYFDHADIVKACIFPRPFMMIGTAYDEDMPESGVNRLVQEVSPLYEGADISEKFKVYQPEGNHVYLYEYFEYMYQWFKHYLIDK